MKSEDSDKIGIINDTKKLSSKEISPTTIKRWERTCRGCNTSIFYKRKNAFRRAVRENRMCHKCSNEILRSNLGEFMRKAKKIHENKYDYSKFLYVRADIKGIIICKTCKSEFLQTPCGHLSGFGCSACAKNKRLTLKEFVDRAIIIHKNKFDYSKFIYVNSETKGKIRCKICHYKFMQRPHGHLNGDGCPKCDGHNKTTSDFIKEAALIHGDKYDYSKYVYTNSKTIGIIICKNCGYEFNQSPNHHLCDHGCPRCQFIISEPETEFLDHINIINRQIRISNKRVDGYDPQTKTIYEFLGDYWHGNPRIFNGGDYNKMCHKTYGELFDMTMNRFHKFKTDGYVVKYIWEFDWKSFKRGHVHHPKILEYNK